MSKRYSGKSFKDSSVSKKPKLSLKEKRKQKKEHGLIWENYPKNPNAFLLPIMSKKYLKEIGYKK